MIGVDGNSQGTAVNKPGNSRMRMMFIVVIGMLILGLAALAASRYGTLLGTRAPAVRSAAEEGVLKAQPAGDHTLTYTAKLRDGQTITKTVHFSVQEGSPSGDGYGGCDPYTGGCGDDGYSGGGY